MDKKPLHVLSLGAGVQSSTIALMPSHGLISPMPDAAIFADTQEEPKKVYEWLDYLEMRLPFPVYRVTKGSLGDDGLKIYTSKKSGKRYIKTLMPAFVLQPDGKKGLLGRKCTKDYKVAQIIAKVKSLLGRDAILEWRRKHKSSLKELSSWRTECEKIKKDNKLRAKGDRLPIPMRPEIAWQECQSDPLAVSWIGISTDEASRIKESYEPFIVNRWPLIEINKSREQCLAWMFENGYPEPPRSACKQCPFHSDDEWIRQRDNEPEEFAYSVQYEKALQNAAANQEALTGVPYLHDSCVPLDQVVFKPTEPGRKQVSMFGNECEGLCGV